MPACFQVRRHRFVRGQHELLDQPVSDVARRARHAGHLAEFVEFDQRLRQIEIDRAAAHALAIQISASSRISSKRSTSGA